jgi:hypothetical protein
VAKTARPAVGVWRISKRGDIGAPGRRPVFCEAGGKGVSDGGGVEAESREGYVSVEVVNIVVDGDRSTAVSQECEVREDFIKLNAYSRKYT